MIEYKIDEGLELLNIAEGDLAASKCLFLVKLYPQALFYYQQSIEKAFKTLLFSMGLLSYTEMKNNIRHNIFNIFVLISDEKSGKKISKIKSNLPKIGETKFINMLSQYYSSLNEEKVRKFFQLSNEVESNEGVIKEVINYLNGYYKETIEINRAGKDSELYKNLIDNKKSETVETLKEFFESLAFYPGLSDIFRNIEVKKEIDELFDLFKKILIPFFTTSIYLAVSLILISFLTKLLADKTRYIEKNFNPSDFYTKNHPLVLNLEELSKLQDKNLNLLKKWMEYLGQTPEELREILWVLKKK